LEVGVANGWFLVHAPRPLLDASIKLTARLAPKRRCCPSVAEAA
jgi:hypothetical protein